MTLQVAFVNVPATRHQYDSLYVGSDVESELTLRRSYIYSSSYHAECQAETNDFRYNNSLAWFDLMTRYLAILRTLRADLSSQAIHRLNVLADDTHRQVRRT